MRSKNFKVVLFLLAVMAVSTFTATAQQQVWSENNQDRSSIVTDKAVARQSFPQNFKLFNLDIAPMRQQLMSIVGEQARGKSTIISLPNADGGIEYFEVNEASNFEPELQARFPEIRSYSGRGLTDQYATLRLSVDDRGIQTIVFRTDTENEFIEAYSQDHGTYAVFRSSREKGKLPWACSTDEKKMFSVWNSQFDLPAADASRSNTGELKTMRLAQSCNGEYSNFFGATSPAQVNLVLAAFNATLTRANGVYEKDLAIHLNLIPNTTAVIYYDPATDPYTTLSAWNGQLQATLNTNIGAANYDIGHMFGASGGGGNAGCIGCVCVDATKGSGITSPADAIPQGDNFDIDYVVHEVGHQMGANHTFSMSSEGTGVNKEVGSGITIMGYAGITSQDVAPHSIDVFHEASIQQIQVNMATKTCPVTVNMTANATPVVNAVPNYTIPITTPFALTGSATDANGDPLTYNWEQNDNSTTTGAASVASPTKTTGPNWLTFPSTASPTRMFPRLSTILAGQAVTGPLPGGDAGANIEALSSVARTLNFRLTVRDNKPYVAGSTIGQTQFTDTVVTVSAAGGPFRITSGNTATNLVSGNNYNVTWDVNGTAAAPFNAANVKISFSSDGGQTFPTVLAASTANDGSETIAVPAATTGTGRIKIEAIGNIFFDINDANFTIVQPGGPADVVGGQVAITAESCGAGNGTPDPNETVTVSLPLSNNGGSATTNLTATLQATGGVSSAVSQSYGAIAAGATVTRNFTFTVSSSLACGSNVVLTFKIADGATNYTDVTKTYTTGTPVVSLTQNFDGVTAPALPANWTNTQTSGTLINWVTTTNTPSSAPNAAFANDPAGVNAAALVSPAVTINSATASIKFKNKYITESTYDGMVLEFSTNGGTTWTDVITGGGTFVSGGYNAAISTGFSSPIAGRQAWTGTSTGGFIDTQVTLPASLNGQSVQFRWIMASDTTIASTGVWVDDVQVLGGVTCACSGGPTCGIQKRFDYDGDSKADVSVYRAGGGSVWYLLNSNSASTSPNFGSTGDIITPADYDGDGKTDIAVFRSGTWYLQRSTAGFTGIQFGASGDIPQPMDTTGDGKAELVVFRPSNGTWYTYNTTGGAVTGTQFGATGDKPVIGDYDGDCKGDLAVFRSGTWYISKSSGGFQTVNFGLTGDKLVPADYDGDGKTDVAVFRTNTWYIQGSTAGFSGVQFGASGDIPVAADYDGDNKADLAVFRGGIWYIQRTTAGFTGIQFGISSDLPTPSAYVQ